MWGKTRQIASRVDAHGLSQEDLDAVRAPLAELVAETLPPELQKLWRQAADAGEAHVRNEARKAGEFYAPLPGAQERTQE